MECYDIHNLSTGTKVEQFDLRSSSCSPGDGNTYPYRSGILVSNASWAPSVYIESRIFAQGPTNCSSVVANWPAFWLTGANWPDPIEIDMMEGQGNGTTGNVGQFCATYHWDDQTNPQEQQTCGSNASYPADAWHVFGVLWTPTSVTYYYDGKELMKITSNVGTAPMLIVMSLQTGEWGGPLRVPSTMYSEYVHVYQQNGTAVSPETGYGGPGSTAAR